MVVDNAVVGSPRDAGSDARVDDDDNDAAAVDDDIRMGAVGANPLTPAALRDIE